MNRAYVEGENFESVDFQKSKLVKGEYEHCTFRHSRLADIDLNDITFVACEFLECDFSMAKLRGSSFRDVKFIRCKLLGLRFDECNPLLLSFSFQDCVLNFSSFYKLKLKGTSFKTCKLEEVDFVETDLTNSRFDQCDLKLASFENTILVGADLRTAINYSIDPEKNKIKKAKFSLPGVVGLLDQFDITIE
jgi:fluoroquinolone resistance protein